MVWFANKEQDDRRQMLYGASCDHGMSVTASKYASILLRVQLKFWSVIG